MTNNNNKISAVSSNLPEYVWYINNKKTYNNIFVRSDYNPESPNY